MWLVQSCCRFLGLLRETFKSSRFGRDDLHCYKSSREKWLSKGTYGCYGKNLLFYLIPFYFFVQLLIMKGMIGMGL